MDNIIGIDPGLSGAICILTQHDELIYDMPTLEYSIAGGKKRREVNVGKLASIVGKINADRAYLEAVAGMPGMGGTQMFAFGQSYGMTKAALVLTHTPYEMVSPMKWKNYFGLKRTKGMTKDEFKQKSLDLAIQLFPEKAKMFSRKKDDGRAEAALIAYYGRETSDPAKL